MFWGRREGGVGKDREIVVDCGRGSERTMKFVGGVERWM